MIMLLYPIHVYTADTKRAKLLAEKKDGMAQQKKNESGAKRNNFHYFI